MKLKCEDCDNFFIRPDDYMSINRTDVMFRWKSKKCDICLGKRIDAATGKLSHILEVLAKENPVQ